MHLRSNRRTDHGRAGPGPDIVLNDKNRPDASLLLAHDLAQICKINISSLNQHTFSPHTL